MLADIDMAARCAGNADERHCDEISATAAGCGERAMGGTTERRLVPAGHSSSWSTLDSTADAVERQSVRAAKTAMMTHAWGGRGRPTVSGQLSRFRPGVRGRR